MRYSGFTYNFLLLCFQIFIITIHFENVNGDPSIQPTWETLYPETFEFDKQSIAKQHISKLRLSTDELYLPRTVLPKNYKLKIRPILYQDAIDSDEQFTASGSVEITVVCVTETDSISLHAETQKSITIIEDSVKIETRSNATEVKSIGIRGHWYDQRDTDFYQIQLGNPLMVGVEYVIYIEFVTKIATDILNGLYLSKYKTPSQETKYLAVTQFEDISARKMFPCFDEPDLKATFEITISRHESYNSMSNMPKTFTEIDPSREGFFLDHFPPTPLMSTYLVAIIVSEFSCTKAPSSLYDKTVEACGPPHMIENGGGIHAAHISARILKHYDQLWLQPYPLPKMQSVAIPDFSAGAMENYGLNTYRPTALLYYPGNTTESARYSIENTIAHELAHQNFGDLVTCKTWNQIFLNEGFATYVSYFGVHEVSPEFNTDVGWYTGYFQGALRMDAKPDIHPLVKTNDYFGDFDAITYSKGASLIKMMENILTWDTLLHGLRKYLDTFAYKNTKYQDLFNTLNAQAHLNKTHPGVAEMGEIMENWTTQPGFPLIRVQWVFQKMFLFSQERFIPASTKADLGNKSTPSLWYCPIFIASSADIESEIHKRPKFWLTNKEVNKSWVTKESVEWVIINVNSAAYFRVLYDERLSAAIQTQLDTNPKVYSPLTRAQLIDDAFECGWPNYNAIEVALSRTKFLGEEDDANVWSTALYHFTKIYQMLAEDPVAFGNWKNYLVPRITGALTLVGVEQLPIEKGKVVIQRASLLAWGRTVKAPVVLQYANKLIEKWKAFPDQNPVPIDIRREIYCSSLTAGENEIAEFIVHQYVLERDQDHKRQLLLALGCSEDSEFLQRILDNLTKNGSKVNKDDASALLQKLAGNSVSRLQTYWFLRENFDKLSSYFGTVNIFSGVFSTLSVYWNTEEKLSLIHEFINEFSQQLVPAMQSINSSIQKVTNNIEWMKTFGNPIKIWLENQSENK